MRKTDIPYLIEKWTEFHDESDDWTEKNLAYEVIEDLKDLARG